jgi:hypothetical protein
MATATATATAPTATLHTGTPSFGALPSPPPTAQPAPAAGGSIFDKAVCLSVQLRKPSNRRAADLNKIETDADKDMLSFGKKLLDCGQWRAIMQVDAEIRKVLKTRGLASQLRSGIYLVPLATLEEVDTKLQALIGRREQKIEAFLAAYPGEVEKARVRLNSQFELADYPDVDRLRASFGVELQYLNFGVPGTLQGISKALYERAKQQAHARWAEASEQIQLALRQAMQELVERLTPGADGKKKAFGAGALDKAREFLDTFQARNLTGDTAMEQLVEQAQALLAGADPEKIRSDELFRGELQARFSEIGQQLDALVIEAPVRKFYLESEPQSEPESELESSQPQAEGE